MKIMYLSYWGLEEGLTQSSVLPHLHVLAGKSYVSQIIFLTVERGGEEVKMADEGDKITHFPLYSKNLPIGLVNKISDFILFRNEMIRQVRAHGIDKVICRSSLAGAIGYLVFRKTGIPFIVESFEPHADYMLDARVWSRYGLKYLFQKYWEYKVIVYAQDVVTVSRHYSDHLASTYRKAFHTFGCAVDQRQFAFDPPARDRMRRQLGFEDHHLVGIYVGKFGSLYYDEDAYGIFRRALDFFGSSFRLVILTPASSDEVYARLTQHGIPRDLVTVDLVPHSRVPDYLSASDFAFSMVRPAPVRLFCSPIKDGEYWANGLPILSAEGIGEDSEIIRTEDGGAVFSENLGDLEAALSHIQDLVQGNERAGRIAAIAAKYRSFEPLDMLYDQVLKA